MNRHSTPSETREGGGGDDPDPSAPGGPAPASRDETALLAPFKTLLPPVRTPFLYRVAIVFVTLAMILLPLLYVALVVATGAGVVWHATENVSILTSGNSRMVGRVLVYVAPLFVGAIGLLFLIKPLIAPRGKPPAPYSLDRTGQPFLFTFVERLCDTVGAPRPVRIDVDLRANASASLRRGFQSFIGQDLVLTIGLPLVSGLTVRQLAGILAHEFGHFTQGGGMRLGYVVHRIHRWFARVVYERDAWDERLKRWRDQDSAWQVTVVVASAQGFVWLSRKILWVLMQVGLLLGAFLSRQMEYDADRYEARLAGCDAFEQSMVDLARLSLAEHWAKSDLSQAARGQKLVDDLPSLILANLGQIDARPGLGEKLRVDALGGEHHRLSTHPTNGDRIAAVRRENAPGIFTLESNGTVLFDDFPALSRAATRHHYTVEVGIDLASYELLAADTLAEDLRVRNARVGRVVRHFGGVYPAPVQVFTPKASTLDGARAARDEIRANSEEVRAQQAALEEQIEAWERISGFLQVRRLDPESNTSIAEIEQERDRLATEIEERTRALEPWRAAAERSLLANEFDGTGTDRAAGEGPSPAGDRDDCHAALVGFAKIWEDRRTLAARLTEFLFLLENEPSNLALLERRRHSTACRIYELLGGIHSALEGIAHPFETEEGTSLVADLLPSVPAAKDASDLIVASQRLLERSGALSIECLSPFVLTDERSEESR